MKLGLNAEEFLANWALEHSDELIEALEDIYNDNDLSDQEKMKAIYSKTLNFIFNAMSTAINENNKEMRKQLRRAGIDLAF